MREISFDTETTGMDPNSGHRIVEIGCVELVDKVITGKSFHAYINPKRDMPKSAEDVHGLSEEFLSDKPIFKTIAKDFIDFISDANLVIHNAGFDMKFINWELQNAGFGELSFSRVTDTLKIARNKFPGAKVNLDALCKRFNIDLSKRQKHGALLDAELLADVYIELLGGKQTRMFSLEEKKEETTNVEQNKESRKAVFTKILDVREFPASSEELQAHQEFLSKIKNPVWESA